MALLWCVYLFFCKTFVWGGVLFGLLGSKRKGYNLLHIITDSIQQKIIS